METTINTVVKEGFTEANNLREDFYAESLPDRWTEVGAHLACVRDIQVASVWNIMTESIDSLEG